MVKEKVRAYVWKSGRLKGKRNPGFVRDAKPKKHTGVHKAETVYFKQERFRDDEGRVDKIKNVPVRTRFKSEM